MSAEIGNIVAGILQAREERRAANEARRESQRQASIVEQQGREDVAAERRIAAQEAAQQRARIAGAGVEAEGSPLFLLTQNLAESQLERSLILRGARRRAAEIRQRGRSQARSLRRSSLNRVITASFAGVGLGVQAFNAAGAGESAGLARSRAGHNAGLRAFNRQSTFFSRINNRPTGSSGAQGTSVLQ